MGETDIAIIGLETEDNGRAGGRRVSDWLNEEVPESGVDVAGQQVDAARADEGEDGDCGGTGDIHREFRS